MSPVSAPNDQLSRVDVADIAFVFLDISFDAVDHLLSSRRARA